MSNTMSNLFGDRSNLFGDELLGTDLVADITERYRDALLLNPPTPAFFPSNPHREGFAAQIAPKDVTRFMAVLAGLNLEIRQQEPAAAILRPNKPIPDNGYSEIVEVYPISERPLPPGFAEDGFDGDIEFRPAFDQRDLTPSGGIGGMTITFWLRGPRGAVSWELGTGCFLPHVQAEWAGRFKGGFYKSNAGPVDWHSAVPLTETGTASLDCKLLGPGTPCFTDSGYMIGDQVYAALVTGGELALWEYLLRMYQQQFEPEQDNAQSAITE